MPPFVSEFISEHGYLAVFLLVMLQEMGIPNPVPTELIIIFAGYLTSIGTLGLWETFWVAILGDLIGTTIVCLVFYIFGKIIVKKKPRWLPIQWDKIDKAKKLIHKHGRWVVFVWRLIPYIRGYAAVAAGLLNMPLKHFIPMAFLSSLVSTGGYVLLGHFLGNRWATAMESIGNPAYIGLGVLAIIILFWGIRYIVFRFNRS